MLPTNVMSFMKKMVTTQAAESGTTDSELSEDTGTTFSKLRQLMTATGQVSKATVKAPTEETETKEEETPPTEPQKPKQESGRPTSRAGACRVCLKSFKPDDVSRVCYECQFKVCDDCASYSEIKDYEDPSTWRCSVCRRKIASRGKPIITQESTDSLLEVPVLEALQRRHSDARLSCQGNGPIAGLGSNLAPPRSPELRRHSDVSPASLKELEKFRKVAGERRDDLRWEKDIERKNKSRSGSPDRYDKEKGRASSPQRAIKSPSTEQDEIIGEDEDERRRRAVRRNNAGSTIRRKSRIPRQHSYDEEVKDDDRQTTYPDVLPPPIQLARRASAYDVYATTPAPNLNAMAAAAAQQRTISSHGSREPEERPHGGGRRPSFRAVKPVMPYEMGNSEEKIINLDTISTSDSPAVGNPCDEQPRPIRRRASMLPDISMIRALPSVPVQKVSQSGVARAKAEDDHELLRQGSLAEGEAIKIVIHDVDSDFATSVNTTRKVLLRRDPLLTDKGNRTKGFGMRVVGGKIGHDGRLFASIVWVIPGGPADKAGLQKGDKVLEWAGISLVDRNFEDVAQIIEHSNDIIEILVEHVGDIDQVEDTGPSSTSSKMSGNFGLQLDSDAEKTPSSPTRRKLPKTPEQIVKKPRVNGRVQIHVWYEADRKELVVSVLAADELSCRDEFGTLPEAFAKLVLVPSSDQGCQKTDVSEPTQNPIWNANLTFPGIIGETLMEKTIEVTLWDHYPDGDNVFLGECIVDLQNALETDREVWYRLEDIKGLRSDKPAYTSPRGSLSMEIAQRLLRREIKERSYSEETQSDSAGSPEPYFLHPDHAWQRSASRRGSSQSEQLDIEPYELSKDYSISLPGSRRNSFQSQSGNDSKRGSIVDTEIPIIYTNRERRRSSIARPLIRDEDEFFRSSKKITKKELGRTMSLSNERRRSSCRRDSLIGMMAGLHEKLPLDRNYESDEDDKKTHIKNGNDVQLGPGQLLPKGLKFIRGAQNGEIKLGIYPNRDTLEVEIICARDICPEEQEEPDTYVKVYLRDRSTQNRWLHKKKTRVIRHSRNPQYQQTLKYSSCEVFGRNLFITVWEKKQGFESNQGYGGTEIDLELIKTSKVSVGWYPLFPIYTFTNHNTNLP